MLHRVLLEELFAAHFLKAKAQEASEGREEYLKATLEKSKHNTHQNWT